MIRDARGFGGVWKFRTTGYNSTVGILSSLALIRSFTGGFLAGIPLSLTIQPKVATNPLDGKATTIQVVGVEFAGTIDELRENTLQIVHGDASFRQRLSVIESETRRLISVDSGLIDERADINDEFLPEKPEAPELATATVVESVKPEPAKRGRPPKAEPEPAVVSEPEQSNAPELNTAQDDNVDLFN
jgi:hypothetical protein